MWLYLILKLLKGRNLVMTNQEQELKEYTDQKKAVSKSEVKKAKEKISPSPMSL